MVKRTREIWISPALMILFLLAGGIACGCLQQAPAGAGVVQGPQDAGMVPGLLATVPDVRQSQSYSCGASSLQAVLHYWGIDAREGVLIGELGTSEEAGTSPDALVRVAQSYGLSAGLRTNLTLDDLAQANSERVPVIVACQAWRDESEASLPWESVWESGHYMVVIGIDDENVYFEDPSLLGTRGIIPRDEFLSRWHDYEGKPPFGNSSEVFYHAGIFIRGSRPASYERFTRVD
jgi:predicted double-glycine peptidase